MPAAHFQAPTNTATCIACRPGFAVRFLTTNRAYGHRFGFCVETYDSSCNGRMRAFSGIFGHFWGSPCRTHASTAVLGILVPDTRQHGRAGDPRAGHTPARPAAAANFFICQNPGIAQKKMAAMLAASRPWIVPIRNAICVVCTQP